MPGGQLRHPQYLFPRLFELSALPRQQEGRRENAWQMGSTLRRWPRGHCFSSHSIGSDAASWAHLVARESGKCRVLLGRQVLLWNSGLLLLKGKAREWTLGTSSCLCHNRFLVWSPVWFYYWGNGNIKYQVLNVLLLNSGLNTRNLKNNKQIKLKQSEDQFCGLLGHLDHFTGKNLWSDLHQASWLGCQLTNVQSVGRICL